MRNLFNIKLINRQNLIEENKMQSKRKNKVLIPKKNHNQLLFKLRFSYMNISKEISSGFVVNVMN
jgi:hypothetical protein